MQRALRGALETLGRSRADKTVALIGSSLIIAPLWSSDVNRGYFKTDCMGHHTSRVLTENLQKDGIDADVVSLATAGQFVSDTYLIVDKYLRDKKPQILIYGVAPRDFMDDTSGGLALTSVFDEVVGVEDFNKISALFFNTFEERLDFVLNRSTYLYRKRGRYQTKFQDNFAKLVAKVMGDPQTKVSVSGSNDPLAGFLLAGNRDEIWTKSIEEYGRRYRYFNEQQFNKQKDCFRALLTLCKERNIKLYVMAMPLTADNRKLMPAGFYDRYISFVRQATENASVPFSDLNRGYVDNDFYDTVHLNGLGGEKFLTTVGAVVSAKTSLARSKPSNPTY